MSREMILDSALKAQVADTETVFIFARDADAPRPPPLAILHKAVKDLPLTFTLNDSIAISPDFKLPPASGVVVGARISRLGNATIPSPGDMHGFSQPAEIGGSGIGIIINSPEVS